MKLLADENVPKSTVAALRDNGCDVLYLVEEIPRGQSDHAVLRNARDEKRSILTSDGDFVRLATATRFPHGILLLRCLTGTASVLATQIAKRVSRIRAKVPGAVVILFDTHATVKRYL